MGYIPDHRQTARLYRDTIFGCHVARLDNRGRQDRRRFGVKWPVLMLPHRPYSAGRGQVGELSNDVLKVARICYFLAGYGYH